MNQALVALALTLFVGSAVAQPLQYGDLLLTTAGLEPNTTRVIVLGSDGAYKREIVPSADTYYRETLVHNGILYVGADDEIKRFSLTGEPLPRLTGENNITRLAPARDGSIVAVNGSGQIFWFESTGAVRHFRNTLMQSEPTARGVDVGPDQCSIYYASVVGLAVWNACADTPPMRFGQTRPSGFGYALRMLPDGGYLVAYLTDVGRFDREGNLVRSYGIPSRVVALDVNGRSFWTMPPGVNLLKVSIETGAIEQSVRVEYGPEYLSIVGEPRGGLAAAAIPTLNGFFLALFTAGIAVVAFLRMK